MKEINLVEKEKFLNTLSNQKWQRIGIKRRAGVVVPLFSVYSQESIGVADFFDLRLLIDWAELTGNSIIQLLPLNEMGGLFCPYDAISGFALEPIYISLKPFLNNIRAQEIKEEIKELKEEFSLTDKDYLDYRIKEKKLSLLWKIFIEEKEHLEEGYYNFQEDNAYWLEDFALFKVIKKYQNFKPWYEWENKFKERDSVQLKNFYIQHKLEIEFEKWLQFIAFKQLREIKTYANSKGILLKGDLPILVSRDSADVWSKPHFFKLEYASGAPPDMYCALGQRWGMSPYNWEEISQDNFRYLKEKLRYAQNFYDILRLDHVVGLFRIWSIPYNEPMQNQGLNGFFDPPDEKKWEIQGRTILKVILENTNMLICAEDLGVIPEICTQTLKEFGIPGNDVQRWKKDYRVTFDFLKPQDYRLFSVSMLSTHDTTLWASWWDKEAGTVDKILFMRRCEDRGIDFENIKAKLFDLDNSNDVRLRWRPEIDSEDKLVAILEKPKEQVLDFIGFYKESFGEKEKLSSLLGLKELVSQKCNKEIISSALRLVLRSNSVFCINVIFDWLFFMGLVSDSDRYRINTPGTVSQRNWSVLSPVSLEVLLSHSQNEEIFNLNRETQRI